MRQLKINVIVPVKRFTNAKTRLSPMFSLDERILLSELLLKDTLSTLRKSAALHKVVVVSNSEVVGKLSRQQGAEFLYEPREGGVNSAVALGTTHAIESKVGATLVIPDDLPLLESRDIELVSSMARNLEVSEHKEKYVIICPSLRYDGTNALLRRPPDVINSRYDNNSYRAHLEEASSIPVPFRIFSSTGFMTDLDIPEDARSIVKQSPKNAGRAMRFLQAKLHQLPR